MTESRRSSVWLRLALRAYPRRWRATRETELLDVLRDSVPDQPHWPGWPVLVDLVISGWRTRLRMRPPFWRWIGYRFVGFRLPPDWQDWARNDINGRWWWLRRPLVVTIPLTFVWAHGVLGYHGTAKAIAFSSSVVLYLALWRVGLKRARRKSLRWHAPYSPRVAWVWANVWVPPPTRSRVTPFLAPMGLLLTIGAPFAAWSLPFGSDHEDLGHIVGLTWGAVGSGVVALFVALFALRRRVPARLATRRPGHQQPERVPTTAAAAVLITQVVLEVAICAGQRAGVIPGMFCLLLAGEGLCVGPAMIAFAVAARRSERLLGLDVTLRDCEQAILGSGAVIAPELGQWVTVPRLAPIEGPQLQ